MRRRRVRPISALLVSAIGVGIEALRRFFDWLGYIDTARAALASDSWIRSVVVWTWRQSGLVLSALGLGITIALYFDAPQVVRDWWLGTSILDDLAAERQRAIVDLQNRRVSTQADLQTWIEDYQAWRSKVLDMLTAHFSQSVYGSFETIGTIPAVDHLGAFNGEHNQKLSILDLRIKALQGIIERMS